MVVNMSKTQYLISPSILSADFARLGDEVNAVLAAGADRIHFDVMDNHYVPNLTFGPCVCKALRKHGITAPIDVHLMCQPVDALIESFAKEGASLIYFHPEASSHIDRSLQLIKSYGISAGLVFNPATPLSYLDYCYDKIDAILLMTVNPGFGGQAFIDTSLEKIKTARTMLDAYQIKYKLPNPIRLEIDGGVKINNIAQIAQMGADTFVAGSAIFESDNYKQTIDHMRQALATVK